MRRSFCRGLFLISLLLLNNLVAEKAYHIQTQPGSLIIELSLDSVWVTGDGTIRCSPALSPIYLSNGPPIPAFRDCFLHLPSNVQTRIFPGDLRSLPVPTAQNSPTEQAKGLVLNGPDLPSPPLDNTWFSLEPSPESDLGTTITLYPIHYSGDRLTWTRHLSLMITWPDANAPPVKRLSATRIHSMPHAPPERDVYTGPDIPDYQFSQHLVQVVVNQEGWYGITYSDLLDSNVSINGVDPRTIQLWDRDREVPLIVEGEADGIFDPEDRIIFFGTPAPPPDGVLYRFNFYSQDHHYWLTWGEHPGRRYVDESAYPDTPSDQVLRPDSFMDTLHIEQDDYFARLGSRNLHQEWDRFDHFFMNPPLQGGTSVDFQLQVPYPTASTVKRFTLRAEVQGITENVHQLHVTLNHLILGTATWEGQDSFLFESDPNHFLQNADLVHGDNLLTCTLEGDDPTNRYDQVYLNWVELIYDREYRAEDDYLAFRRDSHLPMTTQFEVAGFTTSDIYLVKSDLTRLTDFLILSSDDHYTIVFQDYTGSDQPRYHAFTNQKIQPVSRLHPVEPISPLLSGITSDYLILAPDSFRTILQPLADYHSAQIIDIDRIYRNYCSGQVSPRAIKAFLSDVWHSGPSGLRYVLIAQQGKWFGWEGGFNHGQRFIPAMKIQTYKFGAVSSDTWYTLVDGDDMIPDFAIGRFPARTGNELETMVSKTLEYLTREDWTSDNRILMIGGYEATFKDQSESLIDPLLAQGYFPKRLYIDRYSEGGPFYGSTDTLLTTLENGVWYVNFLGHGGGAVWGDRSLLTLDDVSRLNNTHRTPLVTSMTCFTGDVTNPNALGRRMMALPNGGALAWFGSAGLGWIINDFLLLEPIHRHLFSDETWTLGEVINQGKVEDLATNTGFPVIARTQVYQFNLSGDPALSIRRPTPTTISLSTTVSSGGESISLGNLPPTADSLTINLYDRENLPLGQFRQSPFTLPMSTPPGLVRVVTAWKDNSQLNHGSALLSVNGSLVHIDQVDPASPTELDSIQIYVNAQDPVGLDSVFLKVNGVIHLLMPDATPGVYRLKTSLPPQPSGSVLYLEPGAINTQNLETWGPAQTIVIQPCLHPVLIDLSFFSDQDLGLLATVKNSTSGSGPLTLVFERLTDSTWIELGTLQTSLPGLTRRSYRLSSPLPRGQSMYRVILSPGPGYTADTLETAIKPFAFWITPDLGTTMDLSTHQVVGIPGVNLEVQPGEVSQPEILTLQEMAKEDVPLQGGIDLVTLDPNRAGVAWDVGSKTPISMDWITAIPDTADYELFIFDKKVQTWQRSSSDNQAITWNGPGIMAWFQITDDTKPVVEASLNGQHFLRDSYISTTPRFTIIAQDDHGMDFRPEAMQCWINRDPERHLSPLRISGRGSAVTYEFYPDLEVSDTLIQFLTTDAVGNRSDTLLLHFMVRSQLDLLDYGNFPNPFTDQTRFAYELTDNVDQFSLDIYTVAGRRVRHFGPQATVTDLDSRSGAYHEIIWDGRDENGHFVSNGVYFYRYHIRKGKHNLYRQGKVAKAR